MSFLGIGGGGNLFSGIASLALQGALGVATGGASLLVTTALKSVMMAVGDQVLQQLGQQLGLPQGAIDLAQAAFHGAAGDPGGAVQNLSEASQGLSSAIGGGAFEAGQIERTAQGQVQDLIAQANEAANRSRDDSSSGDEAGVGRGGRGGDSLLVAIAKAMGKVIDSKMGQMADKTQQMGSAKGEKYGQLSAEVQALGQEISMVSNSLNNAIKAIGEASAQLARKG
ncbi:hypothetical protein ASD89_02585 [Caulobacter sp. Root656]|nr:hypothetical protein ASD89_02585 [Caulobacter sp. Root656]